MSTNQIKKKGRRLGSKNKLGSKAPGPKPAHLVNQTFLDFPIVAEEAESSTTGRSQHSSFFSTAVLQGFESAGSGEINVYPNEENDQVLNQNLVNQNAIDNNGDPSSSTESTHHSIDLNAEDEENVPLVEDDANVPIDSESEDDNSNIEELTEEQITSIENRAAEIPEKGWLDKYLGSIQDKLKGGNTPDEYNQGTFWINPPSISFVLKKKIDPELLYRPRVCVWLPQYLTRTPLRCPKCNNTLLAKEWVQKTKARRIIDLEDCFYLLSVRFKCTNKTTVHTFMGYASEIVRQLPARIQADFPAVLTHRSGFSTKLVKLLRPQFQNATGPHRMNQILRSNHTEKYDTIQFQYYDAMKDKLEEQRKAKQLIGNFSSATSYPEFSSFSDINGYNGYVPSANYLSYVYCSIIAEFRPYMNQHTSLLDGVILKGDHSFKIINHMAKINGVSTFSCLYTVLNEYEEIRLQVLAPTKSLDHLTPSFNNMMESYKKYGFKMPQLFYTDNVLGDRLFLESAIPSLLENVIHVKPTISERIDTNNQFKDCPLATLPTDVIVSVLTTTQQINQSCQQILDDCTQQGNVHIGFDCEWAFRGGNSAISRSEQTRLRFVPVALVQIAFRNTVFLFRIHSLQPEQLPQNLVKVLTDSKIVKIGKNISGDLLRFRYFGLQNFPGQLELGTFCKDKDLIERRSFSLADICGFVLKVQLPKKNLIRCGNWEAENLSEEQINYAALDAWVSLEIYNRFKSMPTVHQKVNNNTRAGSFVAIHLDSTAKSSAAAYGFLCADNTPDNNEIHNPTNINGALVVNVVKVQVPGFPVDCYDDNLTLNDFNGPNFKVYIKRKFLFTASERVHFPAHGDTNNISESTSPNRNGPNSQVSDNPSNQTSVNSRVLKDGFHLMDMIKLNKSHGMHKDFMRRFRDILYVCDQDDKAIVESYLSSIGTDWNTRMLINPAWIFERVRRFVPPPDELHSALKFLFDSYGPLRCENSGHKLFNEAAVEMSLHVLSTVQQGHVSDVVDGPPLYTEKGPDKNNLMRYKCSRGTSSVEGACHMNIVRRFASYNASVRLTDSILADYRLYHNINVGSLNRYGKKHQGHYSPWLVLAINVLRNDVGHATVQDYMCERYGCYLNFDQTRETYGVVEIPRNLANEIGIIPATTQQPRLRTTLNRIMELSSLPVAKLFEAGYSTKQFRYKFLSICQGTLYAITAVHTKEETSLFENLLSTHGQEDTLIFQPFDSKKPNFNLFAYVWNSTYCILNSNIYYKTPGHLQAYYNVLEDRKKYGNTVLKNLEVSKAVRALAEDASRFNRPIPALPQPTHPTLQHLPVSTNIPASPQLAIIRPVHRPRQTSTSLSLPLPRFAHSIIINSGKRKRVCNVCKMDDCSGSSKGSLCSNKCGKCKQDTCPGRHVKQPKTGRRNFSQPLPCLNI